MSFSRLPWRLLVASLGFLVAVAGSAAVFVAAMLVPMFGDPDLVVHAGAQGLGVLGFGLLVETAARSIWPLWLVAAVVIEIVGLRSLLLHLLGFAGLALVGLFGFATGSVGPCDGAAANDCRDLLDAVPGAAVRLTVAAGLVGGFLHWAVAGRGAGLTMRHEQTSTRGDPRPPHA